jgi:hypothetical protein
MKLNRKMSPFEPVVIQLESEEEVVLLYRAIFNSPVTRGMEQLVQYLYDVGARIT